MKTNYIIITLLVIGFLLQSCVVKEVHETGVEGLEPVPESVGLKHESYHIQRGDQLQIKFFYNRDLNTSVVVRTDGKIALQLVGELQAAGLSLTELDEKLTESYGYELVNPEITINLSGSEGLRVYVGGEVVKQGFIEFRNKMTPLQAVLNAGGFKKFADAKSTVVIRKDQNNKPVSIVVDLDMVLAGKNNDSDLFLVPDDIVYVPQRW